MQRTSASLSLSIGSALLLGTLSDVVASRGETLAVRQWGGEESLFQCNGRILVNMLSVFND